MGKRRIRDRAAPSARTPAERSDPEPEATLPGVAGNAAMGRLLRSSTSDGPELAPEGFAGELATSGGRAIPTAQRANLEAGLGTSLDDVRLHTDSAAENLADQVSARAFTVGRDIYFGRGAYDPGSSSGFRLLAHEVTHTLQQSGASAGATLEVSTPDSPAEHEADRVADTLASGRHAEVDTEPDAGVHRQIIQREPTATAERELDAKWQIKPSGVDKALADQILAQPSISLVFYEDYETGLANDAEFKSASADFAKTYKTLGMTSSDKTGGALASGIAIAVKNRDDVAQAITSVHQTVHQLFYERQSANPEGNLVEPQVRTIAIFAHGVRKSLGLDPVGEKGPNWFKAAQIKSFVGAIRGHVAGDVRILLFACSTGGSEKEQQGMPAQGDAGGEGSFAALLAQELGGEATVFAHNVAGHAESNPLARMFTADSATGTQMFDVLYGDEFLRTEAARLGIADDPQAVKRLRATMWAHYVDAVSTDFGRIRTKNRHFAVGGYGGVGAAMFMDPDGTKVVLREDFKTEWLTPDRVRKLATVP